MQGRAVYAVRGAAARWQAVLGAGKSAAVSRWHCMPTHTGGSARICHNAPFKLGRRGRLPSQLGRRGQGPGPPSWLGRRGHGWPPSRLGRRGHGSGPPSQLRHARAPRLRPRRGGGSLASSQGLHGKRIGLERLGAWSARRRAGRYAGRFRLVGGRAVLQRFPRQREKLTREKHPPSSKPSTLTRVCCAALSCDRPSVAACDGFGCGAAAAPSARMRARRVSTGRNIV